MDGILRRNGFEGSYLVAPALERLPETVKDLDFLVRAIVTGDLLYAAPIKRRGELSPEKILSWAELFSLAQTIGELETPGKKIAVVGTPMCLAGLDNGVLDTLDAEENTVYRAPLAEYLCFLWIENEKVKGAVQKLLPQFSGGNGDLYGLSEYAGAPLYSVALDYDWDESAWSKLRSFLYYC